MDVSEIGYECYKAERSDSNIFPGGLACPFTKKLVIYAHILSVMFEDLNVNSSNNVFMLVTPSFGGSGFQFYSVARLP
jgi:hypothetical protein